MNWLVGILATVHEERQIVRLGAGVNEIADFQLARHLCGELFRVFCDIRVQINRG